MTIMSQVSKGPQMWFPLKLHALLNDAEEQGFDGMVSWLPCGKMFLVISPANFEAFIIPRYFNQKHYKSFQRQLNIYGFQRIRDGDHKGAYVHQAFVRDRPELCRFMVRTTVRGTSKPRSLYNKEITSLLQQSHYSAMDKLSPNQGWEELTCQGRSLPEVRCEAIATRFDAKEAEPVCSVEQPNPHLSFICRKDDLKDMEHHELIDLKQGLSMSRIRHLMNGHNMEPKKLKRCSPWEPVHLFDLDDDKKMDDFPIGAIEAKAIMSLLG